MQSILRIKQRRSISRVVVTQSIGLLLPARCFATLCMTFNLLHTAAPPLSYPFLSNTSTTLFQFAEAFTTARKASKSALGQRSCR